MMKPVVVAMAIILCSGCGERRLVTGIGMTVDATLEGSHRVDIEIHIDNGPRHGSWLIPSWAYSQDFGSVTFSFAGAPILELVHQDGRLGIAEGRVMEYEGRDLNEDKSPDFRALLAALDTAGWVPVPVFQEIPGVQFARACPREHPKPQLTISHLLRHPSSISLSMEFVCNYRDGEFLSAWKSVYVSPTPVRDLPSLDYFQTPLPLRSDSPTNPHQP